MRTTSSKVIFPKKSFFCEISKAQASRIPSNERERRDPQRLKKLFLCLLQVIHSEVIHFIEVIDFHREFSTFSLKCSKVLVCSLDDSWQVTFLETENYDRHYYSQLKKD